jgi:IMP dehydrogenase/GMP reductase
MLSVDDVLLVPGFGVLPSREQAELYPFIYSAPMDRVTGYKLAAAMLAEGEIPVISRNLPEAEFEKCLQEFAGEDRVFFAVSAKPEWLSEFFRKLEAAGFDSGKMNLAIDIAHGDSVLAHDCARYLQGLDFVGKIMSGSVATPAGAIRAVLAGCTHVRVGVGPGSMCTTRETTGFGVPQLSAVYHISKAFPYSSPERFITRDEVTIIADGGIRKPGDAVKYLVGGADAIMMGSAFSKTIESPGWYHSGFHPIDESGPVSFPLPDPQPIFSKTYRGCASASHQQDHAGAVRRTPEGESSSEFEWDGTTSVSTVVAMYRGGLASAISYGGLTNMRDLSSKVEMIRVTSSTRIEGSAHGNL